MKSLALSWLTSFCLWLNLLAVNAQQNEAPATTAATAKRTTTLAEPGSASKVVIQVGLVYEAEHDPLTGKIALTMADNALRSAGIIPDWITFNFSIRTGCEYDTGAGAGVELFALDRADVVIGPACDSGMYVVAATGPFYNLPVLGYASTASAFADAKYSTFARTSYSDDQMAIAATNILLHFQWYNFGLIRISDESCNSFQQGMMDNAQLIVNDILLPNMSVTVQSSFPLGQLDRISLQKYNVLRLQARVFVFCAGYDPHDARPLFLKLVEQNMTNHEYVYIIPYLRKNDNYNTRALWQAAVNDGQDELAMQFFKRVILIDNEGGTTGSNNVETFQAKMTQALQSAPYFRSTTTLNASNHIRYLHDTMYLYGIGVNKSFGPNPISSSRNYRDGYGMMTRYMAQNTFEGTYRLLENYRGYTIASGILETKQPIISNFDLGWPWPRSHMEATSPRATGSVRINTYGDRVPYFSMFGFDANEAWSAFANIGFLPPDIYGWKAGNVSYIRKAYWDTPNGLAPLEVPECGFTGMHCVRENTIAIIVGPVVAGLVIIVIVALVVFRLRQLSLESQLLSMTWKIEQHEVQRIHRGKGVKSFEDRLSESGSQMSGQKSSQHSHTASKAISQEMTIQTVHNKAPFIGVGVFRDQRVAVKQIRQYQHVQADFTKKELMALHNLKEIRHDNLNTFLGMILPDSPGMPGLILWVYCPRGSLEDILFNEAIDLDMLFKASMMKDLLKGLDYIHKSEFVAHGSLTTTNCVVDSRWVLKLTDFGYADIVARLSGITKAVNEKDDSIYSTTMYHLAPEVLRGAFEKMSVTPTKEGDSYGFGMILFQILYREQPFTDMTITPAAIVRKIAYPGPTYQILRPKFPQRSAQISSGFKELISQCWEEIASQRPDIEKLKDTIASITKQFSANIIDHVISTMEKYTETLEKVVEDRSKELQEEKARADAILRELLPKSVVDALKAGQSVPPESYELITLYFSDIVQFTKLCSTSTPIEVVAMLNQLYSNFDSICRQYDCYKVETIGDAYMVASGLPIRNGMRHASEIANMALHIRRFVLMDFNVPHRPSDRLQVRIGCHTGPVAAGVIGLAMPRYCVFGDTVNIASKMEANSEPMKIQLSKSTATILRDRGNYVMESRGINDLKGLGEQETFWLIDKAKY